MKGEENTRNNKTFGYLLKASKLINCELIIQFIIAILAEKDFPPF